MKKRVFLAWTFCAAACAQSIPDPEIITRFREKVRSDMARVLNYTCLETVERFHRDMPAHVFKPVDTVRLEVSVVGGKELFAWPGSRQFDDREVTAVVSGGAIGSGIFGTFAKNLFITQNPIFYCSQRDKMDGRNAIRCDYGLNVAESHLRITAGKGAEMVAAKGSFWFDPVTLDLLRLDASGDELPYSLRLEAALFRTDYARVRIGEAQALLPAKTEMTMVNFSGDSDRNAITFTGCREYGAESAISFDAPDAAADKPQAATRTLELPAGLTLNIELETAIDSKTAALGDKLQARVVGKVRAGDIAIPAGATLTGHLRKFEHMRNGPYAIGIEFSEIDWEGYRAPLHAEMMDVDRQSTGSHKPMMYFDGRIRRVAIDNGPRNAAVSFAVFYIQADRFVIPAGLRTTWRVAAP